MQVLTKVETSLKFNQIMLRSEAKNFTEVAALACRGENLFSNNEFPVYPTTSLKCNCCFWLQVHCRAMKGNALVMSV